jgi:diguanylate cyclase (GGDEF)-like protein
MRLQTRIILLMILFFMLFLAFGVVLIRVLLTPVQIAAEEEIAEINLARVAQALRRESEHLGVLIGDWAQWDETYRFVQDRNMKFQVTNLSPDTFRKTRLDLLIFIDKEGETVWSNQFDRPAQQQRHISELPTGHWPPDHPLLQFEDPKTPKTGILVTGQGPLQIASSPVLTSMGTGARQGTVVMGRFLDQDEIKRLNEQTRVSFDLHPAGEVQVPDESYRLPYYLDRFELLPEARTLLQDPDFSHLLGEDSELSQPRFYRDPQAPDRMRIFAHYPDIHGEPALLLEVRVPRIFNHLGRRLAIVVFASLAAIGILFSAVHLFIIRRIVTKPLGRLRRHIAEVQTDESLSERIGVRSNSEIGELVHEYNKMLERLEENRRRRVEAEGQLRASERRFKELSIRDDLTGLYNTRYFYQGLKHHFEKCARLNRPLALIFLDVDRFKQVVDTHGHIRGSQALREVAQTIKACIEAPAFAVAYGGDEYVVVLPDKSRADAVRKAEEIREHMSATSYLAEHGLDVRLTASFGIAGFPEDAQDLEELLAIADSSLFYVKSIGRDGIA